MVNLMSAGKKANARISVFRRSIRARPLKGNVLLAGTITNAPKNIIITRIKIIWIIKSIITPIPMIINHI